MAVNITLEPKETSFIIGDDYRKDNNIKFKIKLEVKEDDKEGVKKDVDLRLQIPVGPSGVMSDSAHANNIMVKISGRKAESVTPEPPPEKVGDKKVDDTNTKQYQPEEVFDVDGEKVVDVSIDNVLCRADTTDSEIRIIWSTDNKWTVLTPSILVKKKKPTEAKNPILYFIAEPTFLIGEGDVTLKWDLAKDGTPELETPAGTKHSLSSGAVQNKSTTVKCTKSGAYTLRLDGQERQVNVNVQTKGWYAIEPLANSVIPPHRLEKEVGDIKKWKVTPSVVFQSGESDTELYAILVRGQENAARSAVLCKSADGITRWDTVTDRVPERMESSPGVHLGKRLWLIGGSAVDPEQQSSEIWYYDLDQPSSGWNKAKVEFVDPNVKFEERMGHACVIAADKTIWVIGGLGRVNCLNDVWQFTLDDKDRSKLNASRLLEHSGWAPRYMFSATKHSDMIWVFGGVDLYDNPVGDIWATALSPLLGWKQLVAPTYTKDEGQNKVVVPNDQVANAIGTGADACDGELYTVARTRIRAGSGWDLKRKMRRLAGIKTRDGKWETNWEETETVLDPPDVSKVMANTDKAHSITMTSFQKRLYLRLLHRNALYGEAASAPLFVCVP